MRLLRTYNGFDHHARMRVDRYQKQQYAAGRPRATTCCACHDERGPFLHHCEDYSMPYGPHIWQFPMCVRCHSSLHCRFSAHGRIRWDALRNELRRKNGGVPTVLDAIDRGLYTPASNVKPSLVDELRTRVADAWRRLLGAAEGEL